MTALAALLTFAVVMAAVVMVTVTLLRAVSKVAFEKGGSPRLQ